jgi:hypothetical protein
MPIDWGYVKKATLWNYDPLIEKLKQVLDYSFVQQHYHHTMEEAASFALRLQSGYLQNGQPADFIQEIADHLKELGSLGAQDYQDLVARVDTRARCETFIKETGFSFQALIDTLGYLLRWGLPFMCPLKELINVDSEAELSALQALRAQKIKSNLDVLETCRTAAGRCRLAGETGTDEALLLDLAHRADMTRLAYVRGKTVLHLCGGGYDSLDKLAADDLEKMEAAMSDYYRSLGKSLSDFKAAIPLDWMVGGAKVLPRVIERVAK